MIGNYSAASSGLPWEVLKQPIPDDDAQISSIALNWKHESVMKISVVDSLLRLQRLKKKGPNMS